MFEKTLSDKLKVIFAVEKVTYAAPSPSHEQDCLFIEVQVSKNVIKDGRAYARVTGRGTIYSTSEKMPFGYLSKQIAIAGRAGSAKDLFFFDLEQNSPLYQNVVQRGFSFVYFFNSQYDPAIGTITTVKTEVAT